MEHLSEKKRFSVIARAKSVKHAVRGVSIIFQTQHNAWVHGFVGVVVVALGFILHISHLEWVAIIFAVTMVLAAEGFNTALEIDIDLTSPEEHPYARDTKDVAAGAVLVTALGAAAVGLVIFVPKIVTILS